MEQRQGVTEFEFDGGEEVDNGEEAEEAGEAEEAEEEDGEDDESPVEFDFFGGTGEEDDRDIVNEENEDVDRLTIERSRSSTAAFRAMSGPSSSSLSSPRAAPGPLFFFVLGLISSTS